MNNDQFKGGVRLSKGRAQSALGGLFGSRRRQVRGAYNHIAGSAQYAYGSARDIYGDTSERAKIFANDSADTLREMAKYSQSAGRQIASAADQKTVLVAAALFALGFVAGWLSRPNPPMQKSNVRARAINPPASRKSARKVRTVANEVNQ